MKQKAGGAIGPFHQFSEITDALKLRSAEYYDLTLEHEVQVRPDKAPFKLVPCTVCKRAIVVNTFYVLAWAKCHESGCSGQTKEKASVGVAQAGRTDPATAVNLSECLINEGFTQAICPVRSDDPEHVMELKSVHHNDFYGPSELIGYEGNKPVYRQLEKGETAMWQCLKCKATTTYSTTAQSQFRRINEVGEGRHNNGWNVTLGVRREGLAMDDDDDDETVITRYPA